MQLINLNLQQRQEEFKERRRLIKRDAKMAISAEMDKYYCDSKKIDAQAEEEKRRKKEDMDRMIEMIRVRMHEQMQEVNREEDELRKDIEVQFRMLKEGGAL